MRQASIKLKKSEWKREKEKERDRERIELGMVGVMVHKSQCGRTKSLPRKNGIINL